MKRLHVHVTVADLDQSVRFYSTLFAAQPTVLKDDYAKWMLEDPRVNFAISARGNAMPGLEHLGIQAETADELTDVWSRLKDAEGPVLEEGATTCCYARSEKAWITDPSGLPWETFLTTGESTTYGDSSMIRPSADTAEASACCVPSAEKIAAAAQKAESSCCVPSSGCC